MVNIPQMADQSSFLSVLSDSDVGNHVSKTILILSHMQQLNFASIHHQYHSSSVTSFVWQQEWSHKSRGVTVLSWEFLWQAVVEDQLRQLLHSLPTDKIDKCTEYFKSTALQEGSKLSKEERVSCCPA